MAEAILFGHRALQPLIDIQEELRAGRRQGQEHARSSSRAPAPSSTSPKAVAAGDAFVVVDVETTGTDPKMADLVEIAAVKVQGGKIADRWSTLVNPGRPIVGNQMHGITDADVKKAPTPADAAKDAARVHRRRAHRRPHRRLRPRLPRGRARRRDALRAGSLPRHADHRPRGLPGPRELQARRRCRTSSASSSPRRTAPLPDAEATANLLIWFGNDLPGRIAALKAAIADSVRANRTGGDPKAHPRGRPPRGARQQEPLQPPPQEDLPRAGPRRGHPHGRPRPDRAPPDLGRGRPPAARPRLRRSSPAARPRS